MAPSAPTLTAAPSLNLAPPQAPATKVTVCSECLSVLFDGVGHDQLCSQTGELR